MNFSAKKILLPRFDSHGDLVLFSGFISELVEEFPDTVFTILVRQGYDQISALLPSGIRWLTTTIKPYGAFRSEYQPEIERLVDLIKHENFDLLLTTVYNRNWLDELLSASLHDTVRIAIGEPREIPKQVRAIAESFEINIDSPYDRIIEVDQWAHETVKYQQLWDELFPDSHLKIAPPHLVVSRELEICARKVLVRLGLEGAGFVACIPGGTQNVVIKCWPLEQYADVLCWLFNNYALTPLLIGHAEEAELLNQLASIVRKRSVPYQVWLGHDDDFALMAAILRQSRFYLGNDTGPLHVAGAVGIPVVGLYGGGTWPRFTPANTPSIALAGEMNCFGCLWNCQYSDGKCVTLVEVDDVKSAIKSMLDGDITAGRIVRTRSYSAPRWLDFLRRNIVVRLIKSLLCKLARGEH